MFRSFDPDDGLNQLATVNGTAAAYDADGNMTTDPVTAKTYLYFSSNGLLRNTPSPWTSLDYDAFDRLLFTEYPVTYYVFDGNDQIAQYDASNVLQKRWVFDDRGSPLVEYDASGNRTFLETDERGSVIALANDSATVTAINTYDEYGVPSATNQGTFQYTGAMWLSGPGLYLNGLRDYGAHLGRFNQTDPMGYGGDGPNLYAYVLNDPVNRVDPLGLCVGGSVGGNKSNIVITACRRLDKPPALPPVSVTSGSDSAGQSPDETRGEDITVTGKRQRNGSPHKYVITWSSLCPASTVFSYFKQAGHSAPGAPVAREGFTPRIVLPSMLPWRSPDNPISQRVNSPTMTIRNETLTGHVFYPGDVIIQVAPYASSIGSQITITGTGTGDYPGFNDTVGYAWFGLDAAEAADSCF